MAEAALALGVLQVVVPVAMHLTPGVWKKTVEILKALQSRLSGTPEDNESLSIIRTTMAKLEQIKWNLVPTAGSLLVKLHSHAVSLKRMIENFRFFQRNRISKRIKSIALTLGLLANISGGTTEDRVTVFYQGHKENLCKDLLEKAIDDDFQPLIVRTESEVYKLKTFHGIRYEFQYKSGHGYPRTLTISRSARDCIEHLLKWLRDLALLQENNIIRCSIDVALCEVFIEILPQVLTEHLIRSRYQLDQTKIKQFHSNVCFLRAFSVSSTFREIQGAAGLKLDDEEKVSFDLRDAKWKTWNDLQESLEVDLNNAGRPPRNALQQRSGDYRTSTSAVAETRSTTISEVVDPNACVLCGLHIQGDNPAEVDSLRAQHHEKCFKREETLQRRASWQGRDLHNDPVLDKRWSL